METDHVFATVKAFIAREKSLLGHKLFAELFAGLRYCTTFASRKAKNAFLAQSVRASDC